MASSLRARKNINYRLLHEGDFVTDKKKTKIKTKKITLDDEFYVERLIWRKKDQNDNLYLVKWKGYHDYDSTWEPESHIPASLINVPKEDLDRCVTRLRRLSYATSILSALLVALGAAAVFVTSPQYPYPVNVGGACFFGCMGLVNGGSGVWMCEEIYRMYRTGDVSSCYIRFSWRGVQWILRWLNLIACILAVVFSGILATRACIDTIRDNGNDVISRVACGPRPSTSLTFSILICVFSAFLIMLKLTFHFLLRNPVIKDFRRRTEDLECQKGKVQIKTVTYRCPNTPAERTLR